MVADSNIIDFEFFENESYSLKSTGTLLPAFDKKYFFCGDYAIEKSYSKPFVLGIKKSENCFKNYDNDRSTPKRVDNLKRTRDKVAQIVYTNLTPHTKFLTLTSKDTVLDVKTFDRLLHTFFQSMKRNGYPLKYIYVYERQKLRGLKENNLGCIHAHLIVFNDEFIPLEILNKCWRNGFLDIKILDGLRCEKNKKTEELIRNPASYVCKYITKESVAEWNEKIFRCSQNLKKPIEVNNEVFISGDSGASTEVSSELAEHFDKDFNVIFENAKICRYSTSKELGKMFINTVISKRKE